ncbi:MAG: helix-turn-helix transcriptional regulator [Candidatus Kapabacteria bacterium]|nr:helix-turn-helix transcriptional regulator [Candidatus Kapabacteria bacterium]
MKFQINKKIFFCPMELTMDVLGGKWKLLILWQLQQGTKRYGELRTALQDITHKMLTQQLRELESDGIVHREVFHVVPPKVEYSLTDRGNRLTTVMESMAEWADMFRIEDEPEKVPKTAQVSKSSKKVATLKVRKQVA